MKAFVVDFNFFIQLKACLLGLSGRSSNSQFIMKKHNFSAGPAILPKSVMQEAAAACVEFNGSGLSILEISHRSADFQAVMEEAEALVRELLGLTDDFAVLFLTGGASSQFFMSALNLLGQKEKAAFVNTGRWSANAIKEAGTFGTVEVIASSEDKNYAYIPKDLDIPTDAKYLHITSNNTVSGTQYHSFPVTDKPLVADMSSDIFSRPLDMNRFGLIYAGAQKNLGPAGTTLVIVRKDLLGKVERSIPTMLDYNTHIKKGSAFNTPPAFPIYVSMLNMRWIKANGGVAAMQKRNAEKAALLYTAITENPNFHCPIAVEDRSVMNAVFLPTDESRTADFIAAAAAAGCVGIKGHRSVGGFRASMYNAMGKESVQALVDVMNAF